mgnify:CR=1 FL=1
MVLFQYLNIIHDTSQNKQHDCIFPSFTLFIYKQVLCSCVFSWRHLVLNSFYGLETGVILTDFNTGH